MISRVCAESGSDSSNHLDPGSSSAQMWAEINKRIGGGLLRRAIGAESSKGVRRRCRALEKVTEAQGSLA
jgi:hypothetical protein